VHILTFDDPGMKTEHAYKVSPWFVSTRGFAALRRFTSAAEFEAALTGWRSDAQSRRIFIKFQHGGGGSTIQF
jgi:hypothetical protein